MLNMACFQVLDDIDHAFRTAKDQYYHDAIRKTQFCDCFLYDRIWAENFSDPSDTEYNAARYSDPVKEGMYPDDVHVATAYELGRAHEIILRPTTSRQTTYDTPTAGKATVKIRGASTMILRW